MTTRITLADNPAPDQHRVVGSLGVDIGFALWNDQCDALEQDLVTAIPDQATSFELLQRLGHIQSEMARAAAQIGYALALESPRLFDGHRAWVQAAVTRAFPDVVVTWHETEEGVNA